MSLTDRLLHLYQIDAQLRGLRSRLDSAERYHAAQCRNLETLRSELDETQRRRRQVQTAIAGHENQIKSIDERIEKLRGELNNAVNNKQYNATLTELQTVKEQRRGVEDEVLGQMEQVEELQARGTELEGQITEREKVCTLAQQQLDERRADVGDRLGELESERNVALADLPGEATGAYDDAAALNEGEAMAKVEEIDRRRREYACGACNMHLPFDAIATLTGGGDAIVRCPACARILYMAEDMRGALAKR